MASEQSSATILIVDDLEANRYAMARVLERAGMRVLLAADGAEGLALAQRQPDLILLDVRLPDLDGFEVCRRLKADPVTAAIPILQTSADYVSREDKIQGLQSGADGYLIQPISPDELLASVQTRLRIQQTEKALRASEERYRDLVENANCVIQRWKCDGTLTFFNEYAQELFGYREDEVLGRHVGMMLPDRESTGADLTGLVQDIVEHPERYKSFVNENVCKDGRRVWINWTNRPIRDEQGQVVEVLAVGTDITERKRAEDKLRESETRLRAIFDHAGVGIVEVTGGDRFINVNERACLILQRSRDELLRMDVHELTAPEDQELSREVNARIHDGRDQRIAYEKRYLRGDGSRVWVHVTVSAVHDAEGRWLRSITTVEDITERKQAEAALRQLMDELEVRVEQRTAELAAVNQALESFGYTVSHDLRAPLRHISGFIELLREDAGERLDEQGRNYVKIITDSAQRMSRLIDDLLALSRLDRATISARPVAIGRLVEEARRELEPETSDRAIEWQIGPLPEVRGDPTLLRNVVTNLLSNAIKYSRQRDLAVIEVGAQACDGQSVCFVRDNGAGFDMRFVDKLFGVFQRLHPVEVFDGTGIGLASVRRIIERHGGRVWAEGEVDKGATFYFALPK